MRPLGSATDIGVTLSLSEIEIQPTSYLLLQAVDGFRSRHFDDSCRARDVVIRTGPRRSVITLADGVESVRRKYGALYPLFSSPNSVLASCNIDADQTNTRNPAIRACAWTTAFLCTYYGRICITSTLKLCIMQWLQIRREFIRLPFDSDIYVSK